MIDIVEILVHWHAGRKKAEVAESLGVDRGTVAKYTAKAEAEGYVPGARAAVGGAVGGARVTAGSPSWSTPASAASPTPTIDAYRDRHRRDAQDQHRARPCTSACATSTASR